MFRVKAQINSGDPCPKREHRAWNWEETECETLSDAIAWLLDQNASGFEIEEVTVQTQTIASHIERHY